MYSVLKKTYTILILTLSLLLGIIRPASATNHINQILIINSYHAGYTWSDQEMEGIQSALGEDIVVQMEFMDTKRIESEEYIEGFARMLNMKYEQNHFEIIFVTDDLAYQFILQYHDSIFPDIPVVFVGVDWFDEKEVEGLDWITGSVQVVDFAGQIEVIHQMLPDRTSLYLITDSTNLGYTYRQQMQALIETEADLPFDIHILGDMEEGIEWSELINTVARMPGDSVLLYGSFTRDSTGQVINVNEATKTIVKTANVPVFVTSTVNLHDGMLGGKVMDPFTEGQIAGEMGLQILNGTPVDQIPINKEGHSILRFDYTALEKWRISLNSLPENSEIINRPVEEYTISQAVVILGVIVVFVETTLIFLLFWVNQRRKAAETSLREQQVLLEQAVQERTQELEEALAVKNQFLANMSHELRTPLTAIIGFSELLMAQGKDYLTDKQLNSLEHVFKSGEHLHSLINEVLTMTKINSNQVELNRSQVSLRQLVIDAVFMVQPKADKKEIDINATIDPFITRVCVDERRLRQVLLILLDNAVKFSPRHSTIEITARLKVADENRVTISVLDHGIGIASEDQQRIFEPFVQLDHELSRSYEGSGLGLAVCKQLVELHNGTISIESEPNQGTEMIVSLPAEILQLRADNQKTDLIKISGEFPHLKSRHFNILIAEDNPTTLDLLSYIFTSLGIAYISARDGEEAVQIIKKHDLDLVLLDLHLPKLDGYGVLKAVRENEETASLPILVVSAVVFDTEIEQVKEAGANAFLKKPFQLQDLFDLLVQLLEDEPDHLVSE